MGHCRAFFLKGLNDTVKDYLVGRAETESLQELIALAIKIDNRLRERRRESADPCCSWFCHFICCCNQPVPARSVRGKDSSPYSTCLTYGTRGADAAGAPVATLPLINSAFEPLHGTTIFTKLDLQNAYHLVRIKGEEWKTAFDTPLGHFEYLVMPFRLTNASAIFQALVNDVLRDFLNHSVFVYLDNILIFSHSLKEHIVHVRQVLQRLWENKFLRVKSGFHAPSVSFLGYILEKGQVKADPLNIQAVTDWPPPQSHKQLQRFLGFELLPTLHQKAQPGSDPPLTRLSSLSVPFVWLPAAEEAFLELKRRFSSAPVLVQPDPARQFVVEVDASDIGIGAVLSQRATDDKLHPCAFFSKKLSPADRNYDVGNRQLLVVKLVLEEWRHWRGRKHLLRYGRTIRT